MVLGIRFESHNNDDAIAKAAARRARRPWSGKEALYLIFDYYPWGYSIREIHLSSPPSPHRNMTSAAAAAAARGGAPPLASADPLLRIIATRPADPGDLLPIIDVRWRGITSGPRARIMDLPIYLPFGDAAVFSLDVCAFRKLSIDPLWPPRLELRDRSDDGEWSWRELPSPPFEREDMASYAAHADGKTILFSAEIEAVPPRLLPDRETVVFSDEVAPVTFAFDTASLVWRRHGDWVMPFTGRAFFVHPLRSFVGLSKDPDTLGHLCSCEAAAVDAGGDAPPAWKLGKEKLFSDDPAETHVGATLIHMGSGSEFCLVHCVSIDIEQGDDDAGDHHELEEGGEEPRRRRYLYRLTTFCLGFDGNGDLTTGGTCEVRCCEAQRWGDCSPPSGKSGGGSDTSPMFMEVLL
ncbi:hypothetical protein HU200_008771 [Digitaria exilis]|uniref:Uncharacterized protein n=1 Tax=Digitaria exilis TaxID=1010633 RepID=A0A835FKQ3_9POAL|nr:hypothetical protein HU200_008771 [Digitaria exilis]